MSKKLGVGSKNIHESIHEGTEAHVHVPGRAYQIKDAAEKLIHMIGGGFFNEPKYYDSNRSPIDFYRELATKGCISNTIIDQMGLTEQATEVIKAAEAVANSDNPEDLLIIASWCRDPEKGLKIRYTPQIMLALAAVNPRTKPFVAKYARQIIRRADEIRYVFAAYLHLFGRKVDGRFKCTIPACLRKALAIAFASQSLYNLLKYDSAEHPKFANVLLTLSDKRLKKLLQRTFGREFDHWPLSRPIFNYFVNNVIDDDAPEQLKIRKQFFAIEDISKVTKELLDNAGLTWENIISHFGSTKETWEMAIPYMGEMALTRNLRNFEQAGIGEAAWDQVYAKCTSITDAKQLPFRFFSASKETTGNNSQSIAAKMLDNSCNNVPGLEGVTAIFIDNSGSCTGCAVSGKSALRVADAGNILAAIIAKKCGRKTKIGVFGDSLIWVPFAENDSCMSIKQKIDSVAIREPRQNHKALAISEEWQYGSGVGGGTETGLWCGIHDLTEKKIHVDRIIICSDFCCYTQGDRNCGMDMNRYFEKGGEKATIQSMLAKYRQQVNGKCWVHSVNLNGHSQSQVKPGGTRTQLLSGWSEQIFGIMHAAEHATDEQVAKEKVEIPTISLLRDRYQVSIMEQKGQKQ